METATLFTISFSAMVTQTFPFTLPLFFFFFLFLLLLPCVLSQREDYEYKEWQQNRFWFWSSDAPMTKALDKLPDVITGSEIILRHFERVEKQVRSHVGTRIPADHNVKPCITRDKTFWSNAVDSSFGAVGFPKPDLSCLTDFTGVFLTVDDHPPYTLDQLYTAAFKRGLAIKKNAKAIASTFIDVESNYTGPDFNFNYPYNTTTVSCVLHAINGVRVNGRWRLATGMQNRPILETLMLFARENIIEYHAVVDGHLGDNLLMRLAERPKTGVNRTIRNDTTTMIFNGRGPANPSMYRNIPIEENPAIVESLDMAQVYIQQAESAITPSNIAILALPLALNIVPVTLFAHVSTMKMLTYLILTDMLTVIPLLIKGIELINIQSGLHRAVVMRVSSSFNSTAAESSAAELWASQCQAKAKVRDVGFAFVTLSVVFLLGGIVLELGARTWVLRRRRRVILEKWSNGSWISDTCSGSDCFQERGSDRYSSDGYPRPQIGKQFVESMQSPK